ncbi:MAG TPA: GIY-YIG nuclease family protein [Steroidobacteraceae bacterium]|nr:GIY-YIG nuclease family protein [Steroidobacteraceae bacterium]
MSTSEDLLLEQAESGSWFVYLLLLTDCTAFKVGFTCNPLQRVYAFHHRYFEAFDLDQSLLIDVYTCEAARELETELKRLLAPNRVAAPSWVAVEAGGITEWFSAVFFSDALAHVREHGVAHTQQLVELRSQLEITLGIHREQFERWTVSELQYIDMLARNIKTSGAARERLHRLGAWMDAYRRFDIQVFADAPDIRQALHELQSSRNFWP